MRPDDIAGIQAVYGPRPAGRTPLRGRLNGTGDSVVFDITAQSGTRIASLSGPQGRDFDLYVRAGTQPTRGTFDVRRFGATANEEVQLQVSGGRVFIMVDSWRGSGDFEVDVEFR